MEVEGRDLNKSAAILEIVGALPQMRTMPNSSLIDPSLHSINQQKMQIDQ